MAVVYGAKTAEPKAKSHNKAGNRNRKWQVILRSVWYLPRRGRFNERRLSEVNGLKLFWLYKIIPEQCQPRDRCRSRPNGPGTRKRRANVRADHHLALALAVEHGRW